VFASGRHGHQRRVSGRAAAFTNDPSTNATLAGLAVDRSERLFQNLDKSSLATMRAGAEADLARPLLDFSNAYRLHLATGASVRQSVNALRRSPAVVYVSRISGRQYAGDIHPIPAGTTEAASAAGATAASLLRQPSVELCPHSSAQSLLNAPATDAAPPSMRSTASSPATGTGRNHHHVSLAAPGRREHR